MFEVCRIEPRRCEIHGIDWVQEFRMMGGKERGTICPKCADEKMHKESVIAQQARHDMDEKRRQQIADNLKAKSGIMPKYLTRTFDNYRVEQDRQQRATNACRSFVDNFKRCQETGASLILAGGRGTGKTHLACAIANSLMDHGKSVAFLPVMKMLRRIRETYRHDSPISEQQAIDALVKVDLLIIDEVGIQRGTESEEHLLFEIINERNGHYAPIILISNLPPKDVQQYIGSRSMERLIEGGAKLIAFDWDSYRGKVLADAELPMGDAIKEPESGTQTVLKPFPKDD